MQVYINTRQKAQFKRKYPPIHVGDSVRTWVKAGSFKKGYDSAWSKEVYKITFIKENQYLINDHRRRIWNRWELLKVDDVQDKDSL